MGSKSRVTGEIVPIIQHYIDHNDTDRYYEPFVGGANVIDKITSDNKFASDLNPYLIALLIHVQNGGALYDAVSKELYDSARDAVKTGNTCGFEDWQLGNIGFLASYNGRWFDGGYAKPGYEETKTGSRYRDYYKEATTNLLEQAPGLKDIVFSVCDYRDAQPEGFVVYCDPPYAGTKQYANAQQFNYEEFWDKMREWSQNNVVIVSEQSAPDDWICVWERQVSRSIKPSDKRRATEKLFMKRG